VVGARDPLSERAARAILRDCEGELGELLPRMRRWFLGQYFALVARLTPRAAETGGVEIDSADEIEAAAIIADVRAALHRVAWGKATLADLESAFPGEGRRN
jgi:hypothetical protein